MVQIRGCSPIESTFPDKKLICTSAEDMEILMSVFLDYFTTNGLIDGTGRNHSYVITRTQNCRHDYRVIKRARSTFQTS